MADSQTQPFFDSSACAAVVHQTLYKYIKDSLFVRNYKKISVPRTLIYLTLHLCKKYSVDILQIFIYISTFIIPSY